VFPRIRSIADELMQNADMPLEGLNAAKSPFIRWYLQQNSTREVVSEAMELIVGARASTRSGQ